MFIPLKMLLIGIDPEKFGLRRQDLGNICSGITVITDHWRFGETKVSLSLCWLDKQRNRPQQNLYTAFQDHSTRHVLVQYISILFSNVLLCVYESLVWETREIYFQHCTLFAIICCVYFIYVFIYLFNYLFTYLIYIYRFIVGRNTWSFNLPTFLVC
jgi:hypothetical protein